MAIIILIVLRIITKFTSVYRPPKQEKKQCFCSLIISMHLQWCRCASTLYSFAVIIIIVCINFVIYNNSTYCMGRVYCTFHKKTDCILSRINNILIMWEHIRTNQISFCMPLVIEVEYIILIQKYVQSWHADY